MRIEYIDRIEDDINEISLDIGGLNYLVIFGSHVNGGFCAIPRLGVSCELSAHDNFSDTCYNTERLRGVIKNKEKACAIACAIHVAASHTP